MEESSKVYFVHSDNPDKIRHAPTLFVLHKFNKIGMILSSCKTVLHLTSTTRCIKFPSSEINPATSNVDMSNAEAKSSCQIQKDENLATSATAETGTKPKMSFQNLHKSAFDLDISNRYEKQISGSIKKYEEKWNHFYKRYLFWKNERLNTIAKLQDLMKKVHDDELTYNKTNIMFKELNVNSRMLKDSNNSTTDFFASLGAFLTDAASGIASVAQAFNVDAYNTEFKKIMEDDAEITKPLYIIRSQCVVQYRDVEEVLRCFHSETFSDTLETLSKTLKLDDLWLDLKNAHGENPVSATVNCLDRFISKNANATTVGKIYNSFRQYVDSNPAALDACKSAGKVVYGIYDTWGRDQKQRKGIAADTSHIANKMIMHEEMQELRQLRSRVDNSEMTQTKLESKIEDAINSLQSELNEISNLFNKSSGVIY
ncbi:hypothetical protein AVEN_225937-1 [Araneus ventricosus]|uniref:Uncharacterized protein n=1 Tax=Araneus ventricosus TaxID=182803 RepID=A0A4Y2GQH8_ARAVE|nr:hypothetical protein AVEN_225937-1 [Araneus ventricosus]